MEEERTIKFDKSVLFKKPNRQALEYRDSLFNKFARNMTSLLEAKEPKRYNSNRGLLDPRRLYRHQMDDNVFYKKTIKPTSDTTFVFLVDASGSMSHTNYNPDTPTHGLSRIEICGAICSAFAKANKAVLGNKIKTEIFTKTEGGEVFNSFVKGSVPILSRVFSNVKNDTDWDKLCGLDTTAPLTARGCETGSYTPEFLLLPALMEWARKNITTKNMVVINLTDGDIVHAFIPEEQLHKATKGLHYQSFRACSDDTKALRIKYLRGVPNITLFLSGMYTSLTHDSLKDIYGTNAVNMSDENFDTEFFKTLNTLLSDYA